MASQKALKDPNFVSTMIGESTTTSGETARIKANPTTGAMLTEESAVAGLTIKFATIAASSSGDNTLVAAVTAKKIRVLNYVLIANAAVNGKFQSAATDISGLLYMAANGGASSGYSPVGHFQTVAGEALELNLSGAVAVGGHLSYVEV